MAVRAGKLRHRIQIQSPTTSRNAETKQAVKTWGTFATVWAKVTPLSGRELVEAQQVAAEVSHSVKIRYRSDVTAKHRVIHDGRTLNVESAFDPDERRREFTLLCKERE